MRKFHCKLEMRYKWCNLNLPFMIYCLLIGAVFDGPMHQTHVAAACFLMALSSLFSPIQQLLIGIEIPINVHVGCI